MAADSDTTIRQMLQGFTAMQANLGLLPMQTTQAMAGTPPPMVMPPPQIAHPAEAAANAMAQQQAAIQATLQAAQVARYQPPPSAPTPVVGAMGGFASMGNPFAPQSIGGGGGGAFSPGIGRSYVQPNMSPQAPSVFNPFAPIVPSSQIHFSTPAMRSLQVMHSSQSQMLGLMAGIGHGGTMLGGAALGGAMGSMLGPLGTVGGALLGGALGSGIGGMMINPVISDIARGRHIQNMSSPFMVSGPYLNTATGQGFNTGAGQQIARGIRGLAHDYDYERTGFNTQDAMRIMQSSAGAGLLSGATSPDMIVSKVKEISKTVKVLMQITGDPDVRSAIQSLGQMRDLGFMGVSGQAGAVANRAMFSRMAGVSQNEMHQTGMYGGSLAGQFNLAGATGYGAGMSGAALANMAVSSGALNELQLARAGGRQGLGQINAGAQLAGLNDDRYMLAALGRDKAGKMTVDIEAYRKAQGMSFDEVTKASAEALRRMGTAGITEWNTQRQELKDRVAQQLSPFEAQNNALKQAIAFQGKFRPGEMALGTALQQTTGMSAENARALEVQAGSRDFYDTQIQQLEAQKRQAYDQERANRERFRTPGLGTRMARGVRGGLASIGDTLTSPFRSIARHMQEADEDEDAANHGELLTRYSESQIARTPGERAMLHSALRDPNMRRAFAQTGSSLLDETGSSRWTAVGGLVGGLAGRVGGTMLGGLAGLAGGAVGSAVGGFAGSIIDGGVGRHMNRLTSMLGLSGVSDENRIATLADRSRSHLFGNRLFESYGDVGTAVRRVRDVTGAADAWSAASKLDAKGSMDVYRRLKETGIDVNAGLEAGTAKLRSIVAGGTASWHHSAEAMGAGELRAAGIEVFKSQGMTQEKAEEAYAARSKDVNAMLVRDVVKGGSHAEKERFMKSLDVKAQIGSIDFRRSQTGGDQLVKDAMAASGLHRKRTASEVRAGYVGGDYEVSDEAIAALKTTFGASDVERDKQGNMTKRAQRVMAMVSAISNTRGDGTPEAKQQAAEYMRQLKSEVGPDEYQAIYTAALDKLEHTGEKGRASLRQLFNVGDAAGAEGRVLEMEKVPKAKMMGADIKSALSKISALAGNDIDLAAAKGDYGEILGSLTNDQIAKIKESNPILAGHLEKLRGLTGDAKINAAADIVEDQMPTSGEERTGGGGGGASAEAIDRQIGDIKDLRAKLATDKSSGKEQLGAASAQLFSSAVERFSKAIEEAKHLGLSPDNQSRWGS